MINEAFWWMSESKMFPAAINVVSKCCCIDPQQVELMFLTFSLHKPPLLLNRTVYPAAVCLEAFWRFDGWKRREMKRRMSSSFSCKKSRNMTSWQLANWNNCHFSFQWIWHLLFVVVKTESESSLQYVTLHYNSCSPNKKQYFPVCVLDGVLEEQWQLAVGILLI